ncbi:hypothetical protein [Phycicoccus sp. DTK01]|uniref:hypothetical protein n=1 Tax=Phycicoccus sp. DTK01 TaxID=2785745 RepID=UPI001A9039DF|nr:hypothetical protein [Phycicoccus sp. DTK01]GIL34737.1 hypothetical protein PDTK01_08130 [Phycicoccus sp. DTK01]
MADETVDWRAAYRYLEHELESVLARVADRMEHLERGAGRSGEVRVRAVTLHQRESGELESVVVADGEDLTYSFVVYRDGVRVREQGTGASNTLVWPPAKRGAYRVEGSATSGTGRTSAEGTSATLTVTEVPQ